MDDSKQDSLITLFKTKKSLTIALLRARESLMLSFRPMLAKHNFTEQQFRVLRVLGEKGPCDAGELADEACILSPSLSRIINTPRRAVSDKTFDLIRSAYSKQDKYSGLLNFILSILSILVSLIKSSF